MTSRPAPRRARRGTAGEESPVPDGVEARCAGGTAHRACVRNGRARDARIIGTATAIVSALIGWFALAALSRILGVGRLGGLAG
jgi:hypothetical protein